jgi:dethiobiotin synthetase
MLRYFVTGTDTGVGKTFVTCALARLGVAAGKRVLAFKPIETGVTNPEGEDQAALCAAAGDWQRGPLRGLYRFPLPAAPLVAASAVGSTIDLEMVLQTANEPTADLVLVEGAGGWRVPITDAVDMGGLAKRLSYPVILVARASLGTINHSLLSIEAIERDGCSLAAIVLSMRPEDDPDFTRSNAAEIRRRWAGRVLLHSAASSDLAHLLG